MKQSFIAILILLACSGQALSDQDVWLDFNATWETNLLTAATSAGVPLFTGGEITAIETAIESAFMTAYDGYTVNFFTVIPPGSHERVDFGAVTTDSNLLGQTSFDFRNGSQGTQDVYVSNFDFFLEPADSRDQQIDELSISLAGTAIHELGHALGLLHEYAYGDLRITPANYGNTQSFQNEHYMATGPTGITEIQRETPRTFSAWSQLHLEAGSRLTDTPISPFLELFVGDVGSGPGSASTLDLQAMPISGADAGFAIAKLADDADVDVFQITIGEESLLSAEIWTAGLFDGTLRLYDSLSMEVAFADNVLYSPTTFGSGTQFRDDPFLLNIPVSPGDYFLEIAAAGPVPVGFGDYDLTLGVFAVPEPGTLISVGFLLLGICLVRPR